jgi:SM-20-related protein
MDSINSAIMEGLAERGWSVCEHFLPPHDIAALSEESSELWRKKALREAGIGSASHTMIRPEIRKDLILWLDPEDLSLPQKKYWQAIDSLRLNLNEAFYLGLNDFEAHFSAYPPGAFYKKHLDQSPKVRDRLISCVLYLNLPWRESDGGQLRIYDEEGKHSHDIYPYAGRLVCFQSANIYHEVLPGRRLRFSLTGWLRKSHPYRWGVIA